ncbi:hypothetical protein MMC30_001955 [Trapelia coarctata]|nr:hypothetical protein [Trapelia coarctata]
MSQPNGTSDATLHGPDPLLSDYSYALLLESQEEPLEGSGAPGVNPCYNQGEQQDADFAYAFQLQNEAEDLQALFIEDMEKLQERRLMEISWKEANHVSNSGEIDPQWIDVNCLRGWLQTCDHVHGAQCNTPPGNVSASLIARPRWLIDVCRGCLVRASPEDRYVALSYVWGNAESIKLTKSNLSEFQRSGALWEIKILLAIPRTVRDVMELVRLLGENFLWVDCLCIVQDDEDTKHDQINSMASIYLNAYVTIIAANGWDANHGLRGIKGVSEARQLSTYNPYHPNGLVEGLQPYNSIWYTRGWTLQELVFSCRKIMFHYQTAIWECNCAVWHEASNAYLDERPGFDHLNELKLSPWTGGFQFTPWPNFQQYAGLVWDFNKRRLSYPQDAIPAFAGITATLSRTFEGAFLCGLPEMFFETALLWQPLSPVQRRVANTSSSTQSPLPSWSWVGWAGEVDRRDWANRYDYLSHRKTDARGIQPPISEVIASVVWHCGDGSGKQKRLVLNSSKRYKSNCNDETKALPAGWYRDPLLGTTDIEFRHVADPKVAFRYPIPVLHPTANPVIREPLPYLFCRTGRAWFRLGDQIDDHVDCTAVTRVIIDASDSWAGFIRLPEVHSTSFKPWGNEITTSASKSATNSSFCELIAISEGQALILPENGVDPSWLPA